MTTTLLALTASLETAKENEILAKARRIDWEEKIIAFTSKGTGLGTSNHKDEQDEGSCHVRINRGSNVTVDLSHWLRIQRGLPPKHPGKKVMRVKFAVDAKAAKELQESDPETWRKIAKCITSKPAKPSVEIVSLEVN